MQPAKAALGWTGTARHLTLGPLIETFRKKIDPPSEQSTNSGLVEMR